MLKGITTSYRTPETTSLKKVGQMLDIAIPGHYDPTSDLDFNTTYMKYYRMLNDQQRQALVRQQEAYLARMRSIYMQANEDID